MEWLPEHIKTWDDEDEVPEGTASISISIDSKRFNSIIFVGGKSYSDNPVLQEKIINWIEQETGLTYEEDFVFGQDEGDRLSFNRIINGLEIRPREWVEIEFDKAGQLVFYSLYGSFMDKPKISKELYTLNLQKAEPLAKKQFQQWDFPSNEQQRFVYMYGIEEVYIRNDLSGTFPLELSHNIREVDYLLEWAEPIHKQFKRKPVKFTEELTIEQALVCEPHQYKKGLRYAALLILEFCSSSCSFSNTSSNDFCSLIWVLVMSFNDDSFRILYTPEAKDCFYITNC